MFKLCVKILSPIALVLTMLSVGQADTIYNESVNGDLSNDGLNPTLVNVSAGNNLIIGTTGSGTAPNTRDYFTIFVPANLQLVSLIELAGTQAGGFGFLGLQSGTQVTLPTNATTADGLLGWVHYAPATTDTDLLPTMAIPARGSSGFTPPLGPGNYAFWLQDTSPGTFAYTFNIVLQPIPEPATLALTLVGLALLPLVRRRTT